MSSKQRLEVWNGTRTKTSGGLTREQLTKNKRGKVVSKKKSEQAGSQNNLGSWLRQKGKKIAKAEMLRKKSKPPADAPLKKAKKAPKKAAPKQAPKKAPKQAPKKAPKQAPKKAAPKQAPKKAAPKQAPKKAAPKVIRRAAKPQKRRATVNPVTGQAYDKFAGPRTDSVVEKGAISIDNMTRRRLRPKKKKASEMDFGAW